MIDLIQHALKSFGHTPNFVDSWLQSFKNNSSKQIIIYRDKLMSCSGILMLIFQNIILTTTTIKDKNC